jgi:hypothetical protein
MPDSIVIARPDYAHADYIWRKQLAAGAVMGRKAVIAACRAEMDWATARYHRSHPSAFQDPGYGVGALRYPHERAAAVVLNVHGHVLGHESRFRDCKARLVAQRKAGWHERAGATIADMREHWRNRHKSWGAFLAATREYQRLRLAADGHQIDLTEIV